MTGDSPRLVVSEGAREAQVALSAYAAAGPVEVRSAVPGMPLPARGAVLVLSLAEARTLLAAPPGAPFMLVLWLARGDKAEPALLSDSHIAGVLRPDAEICLDSWQLSSMTGFLNKMPSPLRSFPASR